jgi:N-acylneuraminate cytidylyltransferase
MRKLILIPARGGSKRLPKKNVTLLNGKPLIGYSIDFAKKICGEEDIICVSSNDEEALKIARSYKIHVPFVRPDYLAMDATGTYEVIMHALEYYGAENFDAVLLLQPTTPLRRVGDYQKMEALFRNEIDMVVSVKISKENPYYSLFEENEDGTLRKSKEAHYTRIQDFPKVFAINGSMYLISVQSLIKSDIQGFKKIEKIEMSEEFSIDIDNIQDWIVAEYIMKENEDN